MLGKPDASLVKKLLTICGGPHLDTKALIEKLDDVAKAVDPDVPTILAEQAKDPVLRTVRSWIRKDNPPGCQSPEIQQSNGLLRYRQDYYRLLIEEEKQLLCYKEPSDTLEEEDFRIYLPLSLFLACFGLGHYNKMGGDMGATKTYASSKRFYFWPRND